MYVLNYESFLISVKNISVPVSPSSIPLLKPTSVPIEAVVEACNFVALKVAWLPWSVTMGSADLSWPLAAPLCPCNV